ncbi:Piso0_002110 [Millerozyma farinosa CBS 7064]|uniref:Piso0_002110 protein n=1 Tax=Pichia sorbitophila (strain ATCC MYA-4447 / BCRC 22081 / CBS 7064 / NBRC 10061 / NRRL Y-12695) TaxID=559304 RepID=G8YBQ5_PICSO|nr:Piso0_002110 [Millerozyma farinosa CBS 7064]
MKKAQQRKVSNTKERIEDDLEKMAGNMDEKPRKRSRRYHAGVWIMLALVAVVLVVRGSLFWSVRLRSESLREQFQREQHEVLGLAGSGQSQDSSRLKVHVPLKSGSRESTRSDLQLLDVNALSVEKTDSDEIRKLDDHQRQQQSESARSVASAGAGASLKAPSAHESLEALKEMLSIAPITVLVGDTCDTDKQDKVLRILFQDLHITPEPKKIDIRRHPLCDSIIEYLQKYYGRGDSYKYKTPPADSRYSSSSSSDNANDSIPRLFVGGLPVGSFDDILHMAKEGELVTLLRAKGEDLIVIG